jgi:hypothetical protein
MRKDIEHFADAIRDRGFDPSDVLARGLGGADAFVDLANKLAQRADASGSYISRSLQSWNQRSF